MSDLLKLIHKAQETIRGVLSVTPAVRSASFSSLFGMDAVLKLENLQRTGSFKPRGAYNKIQSLTDSEKQNGVITASSGNHAQGVAWSAALSGVSSVIVMPETTPIVKRLATKGYGAEVILHGATFTQACEKAREIATNRGMTFVHAFNDELVMAGQGTVGLEILEKLPDIGTVVVPIGGGGLISGIACAIKENNKDIKVVGVESEASSSCKRSLEAGRPVEYKTRPTLADGIAIKTVGDKTFPYIEKYVDEVVTVREDSIAEAVLMLLERKKLVVEGAGAVTIAAAIEGKISRTDGTARDKKTVFLLSGGNIDVTMLDRVIRAGLLKAGRVVRFSVVLPDVPGALAGLATIVSEHKSNIFHVLHERDASDVPAGRARLNIVLEVEDNAHSQRVFAALREKGYEVVE